MKKQIRYFIVFIFANVALEADLYCQSTYPPQIESSKVVTYKTIDGVELKLWIFNPENHKSSDNQAAIVFFFGGGWRQGSPTSFVKQCEYLADRGMVAITADYRVLNRNNVKADKCVTDAKSAIRWVRENAAELGIDPNRIVAGGGSAGGHIAACSGTLTGFEEASENLAVSSRPNAMALFNPALVLAPVKDLDSSHNEKLNGLQERTGADPMSLSPFHHISKDTPPTIIFHGKDDTTVPYITAELFEKKMKTLGNRCELEGYNDAGHGFFNYGKNGNAYFDDTMLKLDDFLVSLKYLEAR